MKDNFDGILRRIFHPSKKFFMKSPYAYLSKCIDPLKPNNTSYSFLIVIICNNFGIYSNWISDCEKQTKIVIVKTRTSELQDAIQDISYSKHTLSYLPGVRLHGGFCEQYDAIRLKLRYISTKIGCQKNWKGF